MSESMNGADSLEAAVEAELREALGPTKALRDQLAAERDDVLARVRTLDSVIRRLDAVLRAAEPKPGPRPKAKPKTASAGPVSGEMRLSVLNALREAGKPLTRNEIAERIGRSATSVGSALATLRVTEEVRLAGRVSKGQGRKGILPQLYGLMEGK